MCHNLSLLYLLQCLTPPRPRVANKNLQTFLQEDTITCNSFVSVLSYNCEHLVSSVSIQSFLSQSFQCESCFTEVAVFSGFFKISAKLFPMPQVGVAIATGLPLSNSGFDETLNLPSALMSSEAVEAVAATDALDEGPFSPPFTPDFASLPFLPLFGCGTNRRDAQVRKPGQKLICTLSRVG